MKIRTDFVTNSSSSSFVVSLEISLDNGNILHAADVTSFVGDGDYILLPEAEFGFSGSWDLRDVVGKYVFDSGKCAKVVSGELRLESHTYGEEAYRSDPCRILGDVFGSSWNAVEDRIKKHHDNEDTLFAFLREQGFLRDYYDESLRNIAKCLLENHDSDTLILQELQENGRVRLSIETDYGLFDTTDEPQWDYVPKETIHFFSEYAETKEKAIEIEQARKKEEARKRKEQIDEPTSEEQEKAQKKMNKYRTKMENKVRSGITLQEMIKSAREMIKSDPYSDKEAFELAIMNLDENADIAFSGKHFVLTGFSNYQYVEEAIIKEIEARGGILHNTMTKSSDYLVICLRGPGASKVKKALEWRKKGISNLIISDFQLWKALLNTPVLSDQEL